MVGGVSHFSFVGPNPGPGSAVWILLGEEKKHLGNLPSQKSCFDGAEIGSLDESHSGTIPSFVRHVFPFKPRVSPPTFPPEDLISGPT